MDKNKIDLTQQKAKNIPAGGTVVGKRNGQTMIFDDASVGGYFVGKLHSEGGIKVINKSTGQPLEVQGSEVIITAPAVADQTKHTFDGKTMNNRQILSKINSDGGGVSFADGGDIPAKIHTTDKQYAFDGKKANDTEIAHHLGYNSTLKNGGQLFSFGDSTYDVAGLYKAIEGDNVNYKIKKVKTFPIKYETYNKKYSETVKPNFVHPQGLMVKLDNGEELLIDGNHRMNNAYINKLETVRVYYISDPKEIARFSKKLSFNLGGHLSEGKSLQDIAKIHNVSLAHVKKQLAIGLEVEKEHFTDLQERERVAKDHLVENANYYTLLEKAGLETGGTLYDSKPFLDYYFGQIAEFLKDQNNIDLKPDFTFFYRGETFIVEPILFLDKNKDAPLKTANFIILDNENETVGEIDFNGNTDNGKNDKKRFTASSEFFEWNALRFDNGGEVVKKGNLLATNDKPSNSNDVRYKKGGKVKENLVKDAKDGNSPSRDLNNYNDLVDVQADGEVGGDSGIYAEGGQVNELKIGDIFKIDSDSKYGGISLYVPSDDSTNFFDNGSELTLKRLNRDGDEDYKVFNVKEQGKNVVVSIGKSALQQLLDRKSLKKISYSKEEDLDFLKDVDNLFVDGGGVEIPKVKFITIGSTGANYASLQNKVFYNYMDLADSLQEAFLANKKKQSYFYFKVNGTDDKFAIQFKDGKNTNLNFNPVTGDSTKIALQLVRRYPSSSKKYDWKDFLESRNRKEEPTSEAKGTDSRKLPFTKEQVDNIPDGEAGFSGLIKDLPAPIFLYIFDEFNRQGLEAKTESRVSDILYSASKEGKEFWREINLGDFTGFKKMFGSSKEASGNIVESIEASLPAGSSNSKKVQSDNYIQLKNALHSFQGVNNQWVELTVKLKNGNSLNTRQIFLTRTPEEDYHFNPEKATEIDLKNVLFARFKDENLNWSEFFKEESGNKNSSSSTKITDLSNTKIWIGSNKEFSKRVQKRALELGWVNENNPKYDDNALYFEPSKQTTVGNSKSIFDSNEAYREIFADDLFDSATEQPKSTTANTVKSIEVRYWIKGNKKIVICNNYIELKNELDAKQNLVNGDWVDLEVNLQNEKGSTVAIWISDKPSKDDDFNSLQSTYEDCKQMLLNQFQDEDYNWSSFFEAKSNSATEQPKVKSTPEKTKSKRNFEAERKYLTARINAMSKELDIKRPSLLNEEIAFYQREINKFILKLRQVMNDEEELKPVADRIKAVYGLKWGEYNKEYPATDLLAYNGVKSELTDEEYLTVRTPEFKAFFGDWVNAQQEDTMAGVSKIINPKTKEPLAVYHGTNVLFTEWKTYATNNAHYFSTKRDFSEFFASQWESRTDKAGVDSKVLKDLNPNKGTFMYRCFIDVKNPIDFSRFGVERRPIRDFLTFLKVNYNIGDYDFWTGIGNSSGFTKDTVVFSWQIIRLWQNFTNYVKLYTTYDGYIFYEYNPNTPTGGVENASLCFCAFESNQVKFSNAYEFNALSNDSRFDFGGEI